ncbi:MAG: hypothetical protein CMI73_01990 [Candidatus Pelagibacter sp.]|nr:hypothetical protein [Candidatus Pelagibacter sp.]|tara:strand:+ start:1387 stop:1671 length:285 start_codon:yes stop_codon:yes gene_type:complete
MLKKAKIYIPSKTATQSGRNNSKKWLLEFNRGNSNYDYLMNWTSTSDTQSQVKLFFDNKEAAIDFATKNNIEYEVQEPKNSKKIIKSYADNFLS